MAKQLIFDDATREKLLKGVNTVAAAVGATLGPKGSNVAIAREWGAPTVIHDGVSVAKEVDLEDPYEDMGAQLVKEAASKTNDVAGDGTTTATILAQAIVQESFRNITAGSNAMMIRKGINKAVDALIPELDKLAVKIKTTAQKEQIARISAQDDQIGRLIAGAIDKMGDEAIITVEESQSAEITVDYKEGMEFDRGYLTPFFITDQSKQEAVLENTYILITDKKLDNMAEALPFINYFFNPETHKDTGIPNRLLVISDTEEGDVLATIAVNVAKGSIQACAIKAPSFGTKRSELLEDLAVLTGGTFISSELGMKLEAVRLEHLGRAEKVVSTKNKTLIIGGFGDKKKIKLRVDAIRHLKNKVDNDFEEEKYEERLAKLTTGIAVISVGANSEAEMKEKKERVIDAISATKAAIAEGIVPGGETALLRASRVLYTLPATGEEQIGIDIVKKAIEAPFRKLMENAAYDPGNMMASLEATAPNIGIDVIDGQKKNLIEAGIIDPVKVTKSALVNAASVATTLMTTNVLIALAPKKDQPHG